MALNIDNSTIGFNQENLNSSITLLQTKVEEIAKTLEESEKHCYETLKEAWSGPSADFFSNLLGNDVYSIIETMNQIFEVTAIQMRRIGTEMQRIDDELMGEMHMGMK